MTRLSERDWLDHGLKTLAKSGFAALKAASLAEALGVSRGSFYWHFQDIHAFKERLLEHWQSQTTDETIRDLDAMEQSHERLSDLMVRAYSAKPQLDRAVRVWADYDKHVRARIKSVDTLRINYICKLLITSGLKEETARRRARFLYAASLGDPSIASGAARSFNSADLEDLAALLTT
ncbi:MAG: TetR/AcrR family transcriptional regulator [Pseudomonadota bacterium]